MSRRASVVNKHYSSPRKESLSADGGGDWVGCGVLPGFLREVRVLYKQPAFITRVYAIAMHLFYFILWDGSLRSLRVSAGASYLILLHTLVCVFFPSILDIKFVGRTSRGHTGGRSHRIFNPPSFCGACLDFCREKDSAIPFPR